VKIVVLGGGNSPEREVSLRSAAAIADAARQAGCDVIVIDPKNGLEQLDKVTKDSMVFPILHGAGGEDGMIQAELEKRHLPYLGTESKESKICFNKKLTRQKLKEAGIPMADGDIVNAKSYRTHVLARLPHVIKVLRGGSSIGTYIVRDPSKIDEQSVRDVFSLDKEAIIEQLIEGPEITVPIFDRAALPVIEIVPPKNQEFDYENKYNGQTQELCPPVSVDDKTQLNAQELAVRVHEVLGARHLSRVDIMVCADNGLIVLELNTIPGMGMQSLYPKSAAAAGISMPELVKKFAGLVERDYNINHEQT
jgi:D-alanine-D-alanine ligase